MCNESMSWILKLYAILKPRVCDSSLPLLAISDPNQMICMSKVILGIGPGLSWRVKKVQN